jgi:hypothetical protein
LDLNVGLAIRKPRHQSLAARHSEKSANFVRERLVGRPAEDFEFVVDTHAMWLAFVLLVWAHLLFSRGSESSHK